MDLPQLRLLWRNRDPEAPLSMRECAGYAETASDAGECLLGYDIARAALAQALGKDKSPSDLTEEDQAWARRLLRAQALCLARTGAPRAALRIFESPPLAGSQDVETLGIEARCHKDLGLAKTDPGERRKSLGEAFRRYREVYRSKGGYWPGINAASMALMLGERAEARQLADSVRPLCLRALEEGASYFPLATLGEAHLIREEWDDARRRYREAAEVAGSNWGNLSTTRRQARFLLEALQADPAPFKACFPVPNVLVFAGHMVDRAGRPSPRFPSHLEPSVASAIREALKETGPVIGFSSAACGADILFQEALRELKMEARVVLPYDASAFRRDSVEIVADGDWGTRFDRVLDYAADTRSASEQRIEVGGVAYDYANWFLLGMATMKARELGSELECLAVWDGRPGDGEGGTASNVARWRRVNHPVRIIKLEPSAESGPPPDAARPKATRASRVEGQIVAILFADAVGFSKLREEELPVFADSFLGLVSRLLEEEDPPVLMKNTWGDGLYLVFSDVRQAGRFALRLNREIAATDWTEKGLRNDLSLRIALHSGPAYRVHDPVIGRDNYIGNHVSMAARIEPIAPPGEVYASRGFAAMAAAVGADEFVCAYVGETALAKKYGDFPLYHVRAVDP